METICEALIAFENDHINWELAGVIWIQGEHEAGLSPTMAGRYWKLLEAFVAAVREDCSSPGLPFVIGEVNSHDWPFAEIVRKGLVSLPSCRSFPRGDTWYSRAETTAGMVASRRKVTRCFTIFSFSRVH